MFSSLSMNNLWGTEGLYEGTIFAPEGAPGSVLRSCRAIINTMAPRRRLTMPLALDTSLFKLQGCCTEKVFTQGQNTDKYSSFFEKQWNITFFCWACWFNGEGNSFAFLASVPARVPLLKVTDKHYSDPWVMHIQPINIKVEFLQCGVQWSSGTYFPKIHNTL